MTSAMASTIGNFDLSAPEFWAQGPGPKHAAFAELRRERPVSFWAENEWLSPDPTTRGEGYWAVTKFDDIIHMSKNPELFKSGGGIVVATNNEQAQEFFGSMIVLDDPRHSRLRKIVSSGFTPRMLKRVEDSVQRIAATIIDDVVEKGSCDFVTDIAAALPLQIICDMMGIPASEYQAVFDRTNTILGASDPEYMAEGADPVAALIEAAMGLAGLMEEMAAARKGGSGDDLTTALVNAEVDGEQLTTSELASFFVLLVVAGNETTRNAISHGLMFLHENPDQRAIWAADFDAVASTAIEEIVRCSTPVAYMRRTATADTELSGTKISEGDKLAMFYLSANRDEAHFANPDVFDVRRTPNNHIGFGGPGPHFCLGAHLARREITVMYREIFKRLPDIHVTGEPEYLRSSFIHGIKHLPCAFTPR